VDDMYVALPSANCCWIWLGLMTSSSTDIATLDLCLSLSQRKAHHLLSSLSKP
jgi:hypothetical protein